jgi:hypothetical protein
VRKRNYGNIGAQGWHRSYSVSIEVDVAKILGVIAFFVLAMLCVDPDVPHESRRGIVHAMGRFLPVQLDLAGHQ